ncbi:response regulator [Polaromonas sp.]|nr:response regulator [Candidatus Saccharibacteria bacterium]
MDEFSSWAKIVIVEDNTALADIYKTRLELLGYICFVAYDGIEGLRLIEKERPGLVMLDIMIPKISGDQLLTILRQTEWGKTVKVLVISNLSETDAPAGIRANGIEGYAVKANLTDDQIDQLVSAIIASPNQAAGTVAENSAIV